MHVQEKLGCSVELMRVDAYTLLMLQQFVTCAHMISQLLSSFIEVCVWYRARPASIMPYIREYYMAECCEYACGAGQDLSALCHRRGV